MPSWPQLAVLALTAVAVVCLFPGEGRPWTAHERFVRIEEQQ